MIVFADENCLCGGCPLKLHENRSKFWRRWKITHNLTQFWFTPGNTYDYQMSGVFFKELEIPEPGVYLGVGSESHAVQTARILIAFEETVILTDVLADYLFPPSQFRRNNLLKEGIPEDKIFVVGDVMIDTLLKFRERARQTDILSEPWTV